MAPLARAALKLGVVVGTVPAACIALGYRTRAVQASENSSQEGSRVFKACDLPIYTNLSKPEETSRENVYPRNSVEEQIGKMRQTAEGFFGKYKETYEGAKQTVETGVEHSKSTLDFVQNNPGELPRVAFITVGSLGGFILGYRGGLFRRLLLGSLTGVSCAALCYPRLTLDLSQQLAENVSQNWQEFNVDELKKGNWPFVKEAECNDEENRKKLGLAKKVTVKKDIPKEIPHLAPVNKAARGDHGQANPADKDLYSTRSS